MRGYALARRPKEIKVKEILLAIEGPDLFERCIFWSDRCSDPNPCPLHHEWKQVKQQLVGGLMERTTLADLMKRTPRGSGVVKRTFVQDRVRRS
jgi:DNA-binding IscR family transcriptional regulator